MASRVLYISFASPVPSKLGPARRNYHVLEQLTRLYDVSLLSLGTPAQAERFAAEFQGRILRVEFVPPHFRRSGKMLRMVGRTITGRCDFTPALDRNLRRACARVLATDSFDAVVLSCVLLRRLPIPASIPVVGDTHNVQFDIQRQMATGAARLHLRTYARWQWRATRREERRCATAVDLLLATSHGDRAIFERELGLSDVAVVRNGIDLDEFAPDNHKPEAGVILFPGLMSYHPNEDAMRWFLDAIFPIVVRRFPSARLVVAGASPSAWLLAQRGHNVEVTGEVPDMRPYLRRASVMIAPLRMGGGTRVKILEAQAIGRPVVSTSLGAAGLDQRHGESILLADDAEHFAEELIRTLRDSELSGRITAAARRHVAEHFDWNQIGEQLGGLLDSRLGLVARTSRPARCAAGGS
jgi:polysaccharide biosynthesis protein PslH